MVVVRVLCPAPVFRAINKVGKISERLPSKSDLGVVKVASNG